MEYVATPTGGRYIPSEKFYNFIIGPVGSGKTLASIMKIIYHAQRQQPGPDGIRRTRWVIVRNTMQQLEDTTMASFFDWFPPGMAGRWSSKRSSFVIETVDMHCEILFRPLDRPEDKRRVLSLEVTGAMLDEFVEIDKDIVEALSGRVGRFPRRQTITGEDGVVREYRATWKGMWGASNPGNEDNWWFDWLYSDWDETWADGMDVNEMFGAAGLPSKDDMLGYFEQPSGFLPTAENLDHLDGGDRYYKNLAIGKTREWIRQFIEVQWGYSVTGQPVHPEFKRAMHVAESPLSPIAAELVVGLDAGLTPSAVLCQETPWGQFVILRELVSADKGARQFCREQLVPLLKSREFRDLPLTIVADPAVTQRSQADELRVIEVLEEEIPWADVTTAWSNLLGDRIDSVSRRLTTLTSNGPGIIIDPRCKVVIAGFTAGYRFGQMPDGTKKPKPMKNKYSHPMDAVQYASMGPIDSGEVKSMKRKPKKQLVLNAGLRY